MDERGDLPRMPYLRKVIAPFVVLLLLVACSVQDTSMAPAGGTQAATASSGSTQEDHSTYTPSVTLTPTITLIPSITPTPTPAPGLEFFNAAYDGASVAGELRNNTGQTIVLITSDYDPEFLFWFDYYEDRSFEIDGKKYIRVDHIYWGPVDVRAEGESDYDIMNCVLYPGENGAIAFGKRGYGQKPEGYYEEWDELSIIPPQLGFFYRYESNYITDPDLEKTFHPKAENISFHIENNYIYFEFDVDMPFAEELDLRKQRLNIPAWVKVYDVQGRLMDVINNNLDLVDYLQLNSMNHISGFTKLTGEPTFDDTREHDHLWRNHIYIKEKDLALINRIEVLVEFRWDASLRQSPCWEVYKKR
jgi:hypothetical protein